MKTSKILNWLLIALTVLMGITTFISREISWWIFLIWLGVVIISRLELALFYKRYDDEQKDRGH